MITYIHFLKCIVMGHIDEGIDEEGVRDVLGAGLAPPLQFYPSCMIGRRPLKEEKMESGWSEG